MKLKNKKTGEIRDISVDGMFAVKSLADLTREWEDYEEPKEYWYIDYDGGILCGEHDNSSAEKMMISMGNCFESLEEAEKAVEKLRAFKRLKDKGMIKYSFKREKGGIDLDYYTFTILAPRDEDSLHLLFGGEE